VEVIHTIGIHDGSQSMGNDHQRQLPAHGLQRVRAVPSRKTSPIGGFRVKVLVARALGTTSLAWISPAGAGPTPAAFAGCLLSRRGRE
jgi:hypothetical protein